jgi:four helix bundle protein
MRNYKNLKIWEQGMELVKQIYVLTAHLPATEKLGLTSQITRAAV